MAEDGFTPAVEGWFENVKPLTARQKELIAEGVRKSNEAEIKKQLGVKQWIKNEDFLTSQLRLASQPTINIQGLVAGYTGPGGKTILPHRAEAKIDLRLVPDMTKDEAVGKLKAHLAKRGFPDIIVNVSGGYGPTQTDENSLLVQSQISALKEAGIEYSLEPRLAGSWPGVIFTGPPLKLPAVGFGHRHRRRGARAQRMVPDREPQPESGGLRRGGDVLRRLSLRAGGHGRAAEAGVGSARAVGRAVVGRQRPAGAAALSASRAWRPRSSSARRSSRPRFSSASDWLVVAASTPAETTFTGMVATSTAVSATVATTQPDRDSATGDEQKQLHSSSLQAHRFLGERFGLAQQRLVRFGARRQRLAPDDHHQRHRHRGDPVEFDMQHGRRRAVDQADQPAQLGHPARERRPTRRAAADARARSGAARRR